MSTPELEALLEQAIEHVNAGELQQGRALFERVLEQDPKNDRAWVWLSGCVEEPMQRRICLQQALSANPNNQAALEGMDVLDGKLAQVSEVPPSLLESRLSAIGMGDRPPTAEPAPAVSRPAPEADAAAPFAPPPTDIAWEQETDETSERPGRSRILLLVAAVLLLFLVVCALVAATVMPSLLQGL